jgi:hypothetical protein
VSCSKNKELKRAMKQWTITFLLKFLFIVRPYSNYKAAEKNASSLLLFIF